MSLFLSQFRGLLEECGKPQKEICADLGISPQKLSKWKTGYSEPNFDDLVMLANYFDVSTDYLLGATEDEESPRFNASAPLPLDEQELLELYRALSYEGKHRLIARAEVMLEDAEQNSKRSKHGA